MLTTAFVPDYEDTGVKNDIKPKATYFRLAIEKGIPLPSPTTNNKALNPRIRWPFEQMDVGDSMLVPDWCDAKQIYAAILKARRDGRLPDGFAIAKRIVEGRRIRIWRIA